MRKNNNNKSYVKFRLLIFSTVFFASVSILGYNLCNNLVKLQRLKSQKRELEKQIVYLIDEKENLESDVERLSDATYIARYAREKYLYSKSGEMIIRIDNSNE